jgi:hypothetical protein
MLKWKYLRKDANACIIAPAYGLSPNHTTQDLADKEIENAKNIVRLYALNPVVFENMTAPGNHTLFDSKDLRFANSDEIRFLHLKEAIL